MEENLHAYTSSLLLFSVEVNGFRFILLLEVVLSSVFGIMLVLRELFFF